MSTNTVTIYSSQSFTAPALGSATYQNPVLVDCSALTSSTGKLFLNITAVTGTTAPGPNAVANFRFTFSSVNTYTPSSSAATLALAQTIPIRLPNSASTTLEIPPGNSVEFQGPYMYVWVDLAGINANFTLSATAYTPFTSGSGGGSGSNASVGTNNTTAPTSSTEIGWVDSTGKLQGVSATNPLPITGSISASNPSVGTNNAAAPASSTQIGFLSGSNLVSASSTNPLPTTVATGTNNIGSITNVTGTVSLPTNAAVETGGNLASIAANLTQLATDSAAATLSVNNNTLNVNSTNYDTITFQVTAISGTLNFKASVDGIQTGVPFFVVSVAGGAAVSSITTTGLYQADVAAIDQLQFQSTGTATIVYVLSATGGVVTIDNFPAQTGANNADGVAAVSTGLNASTGYGYIWNGTNWDRQHAVAGDGQASAGITAATGMMWNGTSYDRIKSSGKTGAQDINATGSFNTVAPIIYSPLTVNNYSTTGATTGVQVQPGAWYAFSISKIYTAATVTFTAAGGTAGTTTINTASTTNIAPGQQIVGTGVPFGALVVTVNANTSVVISVPLTATASGTYTCTSDQFAFTTQFAPDNATWSSVNALYRGVPALATPAPTQYYAGLYLVQAPITTTGNCYLRLNITTLTNVITQIFFDPWQLGATIRLGQCYPNAFTQANWVSGACNIPLFDRSFLTAVTYDVQAFSGTGQTFTWYQTNDPTTATKEATFALSVGQVSPTSAVTSTNTGIYQIGYKLQYCFAVETGTALTGWTTNGVIATVSQSDTVNTNQVIIASNNASNQSTNISQVAGTTPATFTSSGNSRNGLSVQQAPALAVAAFVASQANKTAQAAPYALLVASATDAGLAMDLAFYVSATATSGIPSLSSLTGNVFTTSANHGFNVNTPVAFTTVGSVTGVTANQIYWVTSANLTATTFSISNAPSGPILSAGGSTTSAVLSANGAAQIVVQDSLDAGTSYYDTYHSEIVPYTSVGGRFYFRDIPLLSGKPQILITLIGGSGLTNTTFQFNGAYKSIVTSTTRQFIDRSVIIPGLLNSQPFANTFAVGNTSGGTTLVPNWEFRGSRNYTLGVQSSMYYSAGVTSAPIYGLLTSMDGVWWTDSGASLTVNAGNSYFQTALLNRAPFNYVRPYIKQAATGSGPTIASLSSATFTTTPPHGLQAGNVVVFSNIGQMTGLSINTYYYIIATGLITTAFQVSATPNGSAITPGGTLSGATLYPVTQNYAIVKGQA